MMKSYKLDDNFESTRIPESIKIRNFDTDHMPMKVFYSTVRPGQSQTHKQTTLMHSLEDSSDK